jgi:hypothetical protein
LQSNYVQSELQLNALKTSISSHDTIHQQQQEKIKELSETVFKIDSIQIPSINTKLGQMATDEDIKILKSNIDQV